MLNDTLDLVNSLMEVLQIKIALHILEHAGICTCLVGEIALNYYNVPRVLHVRINRPI